MQLSGIAPYFVKHFEYNILTNKIGVWTMKTLYLALFMMSLVMTLQPISADEQLKNTMVDVWSGNEHHDITVKGGSRIAVTANLKELDTETGNYKPLALRYLNIYLYHADDAGNNGAIMFHDHQLTGFIICDFTTSFILGWGDYNLVASYEGNSRDHLDPSNSTLKIHAV